MIGGFEAWQAVTIRPAVAFHLPRGASARRALAVEMRALPADTPVVFCDGSRRGRGACRRVARRAGIELQGEYLAIPSLRCPRYLVEDAPETLGYLRSELAMLPLRSPALAVAGLTLRVAGALGLWRPLAAATSCRVAVGLPLPHGPAVLARAVAARVGERELRSLLLLTSRDPNAKVTVLLFRPGDPRPAYAVKLPTTGPAETATRREQRLLHDLRRADVGPLAASLPRPLAEVDAQGRRALLMSAVGGSPMFTAYHRWRHTSSRPAVRADFDAAGSWLTEFQRRTASPPAAPDGGGATLAVLRRRFPEETAALGRLERLQAVMARAPAPRTAVHGDFWAGNLLVSGGRVTGVVDWEAGSTCGDPVGDLVRFALSYALYLDRHTRPGARVHGHPGLRAGRWGAGVEYAIAGDGWFPDLFRDFVRRGLARLGIAPELWRPAVLAGLAEVAATADHGGFARSHLELFGSLAEAA